MSRRQLQLQLPLAAAALGLLPNVNPARALELTLADVNPPVAPAAELTQAEAAIVDLFGRSTYSAVNIIDLTLPMAMNTTGEVEIPEGNGTGIVWDSEGHVVTNYHVIANVLDNLKAAPGKLAPGKVGPNVARVTLLRRDGYQQSFLATLVGADKSKDIAVVKVDAPRDLLAPVPLGAARGVRVGQQVLAIGNPFGFDHTLTTGVVSGLDREIQSKVGTTISGGIQTDAAINPGNSGGPLLNSKGELIGMNTAIFTRTGTSAGVGFAINVDTIKRTVPQLIEYGKIVRPSLNVQVASDAVAKQLRVEPGSGALVQAVQGGSAAAKAGLLPTRRSLGGIVAGDVVVAVDGLTVKNALQLSDAIEGFRVGDAVTLRVQRGVGSGKVTEVEIKVGALEQEKS